MNVLKKVLNKHNTNPIFSPFASLLQYTGKSCSIFFFLIFFSNRIEIYYNNVDIRDRAHFYYMLLTHLPKDRMDVILLSSLEVTNNDNKIEGLFFFKEKVSLFILFFRLISINFSNLKKINLSEDPYQLLRLKPIESLPHSFIHMTRINSIYNVNCESFLKEMNVVNKNETPIPGIFCSLISKIKLIFSFNGTNEFIRVFNDGRVHNYICSLLRTSQFS